VTTLLSGGGTRSREALDDDVDLARDRALVTRAQAGDRTAFDDLYVRYYRRLYRFCLRRLHDGFEAEDVAQEAFARAWRALPSFAGDRRFYPWLSVIAAHLCTDVLRRRNRSTPVAEFHQSNVASTDDGGEELMIAAVDSELVSRAFQRLSDRHQRILNLREGSGWSYQQIADHEGVGITAIETLLWRARQALKREFAALAGSEGRTAAWIGGLLSLATLRRMLRAPALAAKRVVHLAQAAPTVAVGSAAAATAVVVAAALSAPATSTSDHSPSVGSSGATLSGASNTPTGAHGGGGTSTSGAAAAPGGSGGSGTSSVAKLPAGGASGPLGGAAGVVNNAAGALGGAGSTINGGVGSTTNNLSQIVGGATSGLGGLVNGVAGGLGQNGPLSPILGPVGSTLSGAAGSVSSTGQGALQQAGGVVSGVTGGVTGGLSGGTGAVSGTASGVTGTVSGATGTTSNSTGSTSSGGSSSCSSDLLGTLLGCG
jgi:RNA polymerase sigma-70 factor (ECF subfamily)